MRQPTKKSEVYVTFFCAENVNLCLSQNFIQLQGNFYPFDELTCHRLKEKQHTYHKDEWVVTSKKGKEMESDADTTPNCSEEKNKKNKAAELLIWREFNLWILLSRQFFLFQIKRYLPNENPREMYKLVIVNPWAVGYVVQKKNLCQIISLSVCDVSKFQLIAGIIKSLPCKSAGQ